MDNNVRDQIKRGQSVLAWRSTHASDCTGPKAVELFGRVEAALSSLSNLGAEQEQASGGSLSGTAGINSLLEAVREDLVIIAGTARTIRKGGDPLDYPFTLPESEAAQVVIDTGEAFYRELQKPGVAQLFLDWEIRADFLQDLRADLDAYEGKVLGRDTNTQERKDAVAAIAEQEEILIHAIDGLDTLFKNKFQGEPAKYASWREASKLVRTRVHPKKPPVV